MAKAEDYEHQPIELVQLTWKAPADNRLTSTEIAVHPNVSGRIIINYPGYRGEREGFNDKHRKLAQYMQGENLGAVVRMQGPGFPKFDSFTDDVLLRQAITFSLENAQDICGVPDPEVFLIGTSAGGGAVAATAPDYEQVTRMLLMAPGANIGMKAVSKGLREFTGEVCIVIGENDENVGVRSGQTFHSLATGASRKELILLPNCDHQFRGTLNGRLMSQAPFYAFAKGKRPRFPNPSGGITLY